MQYTLNSDNTVTLVLDQGELFTINDALDVRVTLATFPKAPADRLPEPERRRAAALERTTYQAQCALEDQIESEQDEPGTNHVPARSELGEALFEMLQRHQPGAGQGKRAHEPGRALRGA